MDIGLVGAGSRVKGKEKREEKEVKNEEGRLTRMVSKLGYRRRHHLSSFRSSVLSCRPGSAIVQLPERIDRAYALGSLNIF